MKAITSNFSFSYLHRDVKPGNYTIGRPDLNELRKVYVLDFGMARKFVHDDGTMKKPRSAAGFRGTVRYAALSCHMQREMCRKDDIGLSFFYFNKTRLFYRILALHGY